ncbi:hypothetical protein CI102_11484 [Trichoderma harzianum]|nr:hypothetical protein CI102_11484 [Trichoderma harzianum]
MRASWPSVCVLPDSPPTLQSTFPGVYSQLEPLFIIPPVIIRLDCLRSRHRVEAACQTQPYGDRRWIVGLYSADISEK